MKERKNIKYVGRRLVWHKQDVEEVVKLLAETRTPEGVELIFDRILTPREINDMARRYKVLKMIDEGKSYSDVVIATGMSSSVICRLSAKCGYGFRKSSGLKKPKKRRVNERKIKLKYKGVRVR